MSDSARKTHLTLMDAALDLQQAGDHEAALTILERARDRAPDYAPVYLLLGVIYQELNQPVEAENKLRKALDLEPEYPEALQALGLLLLEQNRQAEAVGFLKKHLASDPANRPSLRAVATALFRLGQPKDAVPILRQAWLEAGDEKTGREVGRILASIKCLEQAEELLREVVDRFESPETLTERSAILAMMERYSDSITVLKRALEIDVACDRAWRGLAHCYEKTGELDLALDASERALALNSSHYRNWQIYAEVLLRLERTKEALGAIWRGIELIEPTDTEAQDTLSRLLRLEWWCIGVIAQSTPVEDLLKVFEEGRNRFPARDMFAQLQASLLISLGKHEEALLVLDEALLSDAVPRRSLELWRYGTLHLLGREHEAKRFVVSLAAADAEQASHALYFVSDQFYERGQIDAAESITRQLRTVFPNDAGIASGLGFILIGRGMYEDAEEHLNFALDASEEGPVRSMILVSLGYLHLIRSNLTEARRCFYDALSTDGSETASIFHIAYWMTDKVVPDYVSHPTRTLSVSRAVSANRVTLALAQGNVKEAAALAQQIINEAPDDPWGHTMLGWVLRAKMDQEGARQTWQEALELTRDTQDREAITAWLESMANDS